MESKKWWESKTVWSGVITVLAIGAGYFGYEIGGPDKEAMVEAVSGIVSAVGAVLTIFFRIKATKEVK